ncbi:MAG: hypothetical protein ACKO41_03315 [Sphingomonadales bacterium]
MRVAFCIGNPVTDGVAAIVMSWVNSLVLQYPEDRYLLLSEYPLEGYHEALPPNQVSVVYLPRRYSFFPFWSDTLLYQKLVSFQPQLVINAHPAQRLSSRFKQARVSAMAAISTPDGEISFMPLPSPDYNSLSADQKHVVKEQWVFGREYFMLTGPLPSEAQLTFLLQAFSIFKNRQQSGMRLVLPFSLSSHYPLLAKKIDQYKYRSSLIITESISASQVAQLAGAAYALMALGSPGTVLIATLQAWRVGIPLLALPETGLGGHTQQSVLFAAESTKEALANIMMQIYKDESLRLQLIRQGHQCWQDINISSLTAALHQQLQQLGSVSSATGA